MWTDIDNPITGTTHNTTLRIDDNNYISFLYPNRYPFEGTSLGSDKPNEGETALCTNEPWRCLILNGDFRKEYEELVDQGYEACYNFFLSKKEHLSSWSDV